MSSITNSNTSKNNHSTSSNTKTISHKTVVLFYKYFLIENNVNATIISNTKEFLEATCISLHMKGRILLSEEGINGSLSALDDEVMNKFIQCMEDYEYQIKLESEVQAEIQAKEEIKPKVENHNEAEAEAGAGAEIVEQTQQTVKEWRLVHPFENIDWKLSAANNDIHGQEEPFPDLKINIVKEIVSTGNAITRKDIVEHGGTHLTPKEFHQVLQESWGCDGHDNNNEKNTIKKKKELVVIDVRNTYEYAIGHFLNPNESSTNSKNTYDEKDCHEEKKPHRQHQQQRQSKQESNDLNSNNQNGNQNGAHLNLNAALNPEMIAFSTFDDTFCAKNESFLKDKKVLMYCTGGIRCEKASAMLRKRGVEDVSQLQGGIHRYLEEYPNGFFKGKNFVFDYRVALEPETSKTDENGDNEQKWVVGKCIRCNDPFDEMSGSRRCTVCGCLVLVCPTCQKDHREYHCDKHSKWKDYYFTFLEVFDEDELSKQLEELQCEYGNVIGQKNVRRTLMKQINKVKDRLEALRKDEVRVETDAPRKCRTCSQTELVCDGLCWGYWKSSRSATLYKDKEKQ